MKRVLAGVSIAAAVVALVAIASALPRGSQPAGLASTANLASPGHSAFASAPPSAAAEQSSGPCHEHDGLPDSICTSGASDPRVTAANIHQTICVSGYTQTVRPPTSYTDHLKIQQIVAYGYADKNVADYEEDHLIPLELGGDPRDPHNLWPEPRHGPHPASAKDAVENRLHTEVCAGTVTLAEAQNRIAANWETA
jgi:hypothetical protein